LTSPPVRFQDDDVLDGFATAHGEGFVSDRLERNGLAAAVLAVGGDQGNSAGVVIRSRSDWAEKPPKTMEWMAPIRAQACIAQMPSMVIGM
jgi:hypothetical protein